MKSKLFFVLFLCYLLLIWGCSSKYRESIFGNNERPKDYLELKSDGTYYLKEKDKGFAGTYKIENGTITLVLGNGTASRARIDENIITDEHGEIWTLWEEGNTGLAYEEAHKSLTNKIDDLEKLVSQGIMSQNDANKKIKEFVETRISKVEKWKTTNKQVLTLFGEPSASSWEPGKSQFTYETKILTITIDFNKDGVVEDYSNQPKDAMISEGKNISLMAQQYYRKPLSLGGGGNSFEGFKIHEMLQQTENGNYKATNISSQSIQIVCVGKIIGRDGETPRKVTIKVSPTTVDPIIVN